MLEVTTTARLVDYAQLGEGSPYTATIERSELESALRAGRWPDLWLELGSEEETRKLTVELPEDLEAMLESWPGDEVVFAFDADDLAGLFDPEVEAHGIRGALAVAVVAGAVAAPAGLAATPQAANPQVTPQVTAQVSNLAAPQVTGAVSNAQVAGVATRAQVSGLVKAQVVPASFTVKSFGLSSARKKK
jgi:hypothetical protein